MDSRLRVARGIAKTETDAQAPADWQYLQLAKHCNAHGRLLSTESRVVFGEPHALYALFGQSTACAERTHLTMRLFNGYLVRRTLGFSLDQLLA